MKPLEAIQKVRETFRDARRPEGLFIAGTCRCEECEEHNRTLSSHDVHSITMEELGNPGWDPICFASDAAFLYYLPAMFRLAFEDDGYYIYQLLFHLNLPHRMAAVNRSQAIAMKSALDAWAELHAGDIEENCYRKQLDEVLGRLDLVIRGVASV